MSIHDQASSPSSYSVRVAAAACAVGAFAQITGGILETVDRVLPPDPGYALRTTLIAAAYLLLLGGVIGLARSGAAGDGWLGRIGLPMAGLGWLASAIAQIVLQIDFTLAETVIFPAATVLLGLGMLLAGAAVLRARCWHGWHRIVPLLCGLYPFVVIFPVFAALGGPSFLALAGFGLCWLALGIALWTSAAASTSSTARSGIAAGSAP